MATPLELWVEESARLTKPDKIVFCNGSDQENEEHLSGLIHDGILTALNPATYPHCFLHRSNPNDVARTENVTFICTRNKDDAGPTNNWMSPEDGKAKVRPIFDGSMKGRTMYVVPYILGPANSPYSRVGVEITDSPYVVASMRIMSRMGKAALDRIGNSNDFVPGLHSLGDLNPERRFIMHFPEEKLIWSVGSGYGGNALLGKKCFALRIASWMAREQGWMAEHMLILGLEDPSGKVTYMAAAFPSACGKTNLAMMVSALENAGLSRLDRWRRYRLDAHRGRRHAARHQSRSGILRRRARHQHENQSQRDGRAPAQHHLHQRRHDSAIASRGGKASARPPPRGPDRLEGRAVVAG